MRSFMASILYTTSPLDTAPTFAVIFYSTVVAILHIYSNYSVSHIRRRQTIPFNSSVFFFCLLLLHPFRHVSLLLSFLVECDGAWVWVCVCVSVNACNSGCKWEINQRFLVDFDHFVCYSFSNDSIHFSSIFSTRNFVGCCRSCCGHFAHTFGYSLFIYGNFQFLFRLFRFRFCSRPLPVPH